MPAWTLTELMSTLTKSVGLRGDISQSDASLYVNRGIAHVAEHEPSSLMESEWTSSVGSGTSRVTLPTDFLEPRSVLLITPSSQTTGSRTSSYKTLNRVGLEFIDVQDPDSPGEPEDYAFYAGALELRPSSNTTRQLHLRYIAGVTDLTSGSSVPSLDTPWREAALFKAQELVAKELLHDSAMRASAQADYLSLTGSLKNLAARRASGEGRQYFGLGYPRKTYR